MEGCRWEAHTTSCDAGEQTELHACDDILFAGTNEASELLVATLVHANVRDYVFSDRDIPGGWIGERLTRGAKFG